MKITQIIKRAWNNLIGSPDDLSDEEMLEWLGIGTNLKKQEIKTPNESFPYKMEENGGRFLKTGVQNTKNRENMGIEPLRCAQTPYRAKRHAA